MSTEPAHRASGSSWFDAEDAPGRIDLRACIHCGLCLTACPTYRELRIEPDSPRGRLWLMRGLAEGRIAPGEPLVRYVDNCLGCRACETVCPAGVRYGFLLEETRGQLRRHGPPSAGHGAGALARLLGEWALRSLLPEPGRMALATDLLRLLQRGPLAALVRSGLARRTLPAFAIDGFTLTPPLEPRRERALERVGEALPAGARMESRRDSLRFVPAGKPRARVAFFTTCLMEPLFPRVHHASVRLLVVAGCEVVVPRNQTCCGALHAHAGLRREARRLARRNLEAFRGLRYDYLVTHSAGCGAALREYDHLLRDTSEIEAAQAFAARVRDLSEVLAEVGMPAPSAVLASERDPARPLRVAYHDPCHLAHAQRVRESPRMLLRTLPGIELVDLADSDWCCGSAGVYNLTHPEMANAQLAHKLDAIGRAAPEVVVASNPGCMLHIQRGARSRGLELRIEHLAEVLARAWPRPR